MTEIFRSTIPPPAAWTSAELAGKATFVREPSPEALHGLDALAARLRGRELASIRRTDADDPAVNALMREVRAEVMDGRGLVVVRGPDPGRYDPGDYERLYWALGTHLGRGAVQSFMADYVARVERNPDLPQRGTTTDTELRPHTDFHELMSLASISLSPAGGVSRFVSSLALHNEIVRLQPDLLPPLYAGWYNVSGLDREAPPIKTPIFCCVDGRVSCFRNQAFFVDPERAPEPFPPVLAEAMALMDQIAARPDIRADFVLEPGEIAFWHNFTIMHARTAFQDSETRRRLLLRLWLHVDEGGRPMAEAFGSRGRMIDCHHLMGRAPASVPA